MRLRLPLDVVHLQYPIDIREAVEDFPCDLSVGNNALVPIVLQGTWTDEKMFADFSPREIDFSPEERTVRLGNLPNASAYFLDARNELFHFGCFFVYDFVFHSHCIFRFDFSRSASTSSRL